MKRYQKSLRVLVLVLVIVLLCLPVTAFAADSGSCGENLAWTLDENGTLTISGSGEMTDFEERSPWYSLSDSIKAVVIQDGVRSIGSRAFDGCSKLTDVTIPGTVEKIGDYAFNGCINLVEIDIPASVETLGSSVFESCGGLETVTLHSGLKSIGQTAFLSCFSLKEIVIPNSVTELGNRAFQGCDSMTRAVLPSGLTVVDSLFWFCSSLKDVTIPESVVKIGNSSFSDCKSLEKIVIPRNVTYIEMAFTSCKSLRVVVFDGSAPVIEDNNFCDVTANVYYPANDPTWTSEVRTDYGGHLTWLENTSALPAVKMTEAKAYESGIVVRWEAVEEASLYQVYRRASEESSWTLLKNTGGTAYKDTSAKTGVKYYYKVRARDGSLMSSLNIAAVSAKIPTALADVKMESAAAYPDGIIVRWNGVEGAILYQVYRRAASDNTWTLITNTSGVAYKDGSAECNVKYYYRAVARNGSLASSINIPAVSACITPPADVKMLSATGHSTGNIIRWEASEGATLYQVFRREANETAWTLIKNTSGTAYKDETAEVGVKYYYKVRARNGGLTSSLDIPAVSAIRPGA